MGKQKSDILSGMGSGFQIVKALRDAGATNEDLRRIIAENSPLPKQIVEILVAKSVKSVFPSEALAADLIPSGWMVMEDVEPTLKSAADLDFASFLEPGEDYVHGETMRTRAKVKKANLGLVDLAVALADQAKISVEARLYYLVFSGTVLRRPNGNLCVAYLHWDGDRWIVNFNRVADVWYAYDRLARCK